MLINGQINGSGANQLYRNDDNSVFTQVNAQLAKMIGVQRWIDFDQDGFPDIISSGIMDSVWKDTMILYKNNGNGSFTAMSSTFPNVQASDISVFDYDNDSLPDFFITGVIDQTFNAFSAFFHNDGNGNFTMDSISFFHLFTGTSKWGDVDNDGDADILYDGIEFDNKAHSLIYLNDGFNNFSQMATNLPGTGEPGSVDWADIDHDGDLDVLLGGCFLMRNDGNGNFTDISPWFPGFFCLPALFTDYDLDGDDDIFLINYFGNSETTIFRNKLITSVNNINESKGFSLFPNPFSDYVKRMIDAKGEMKEFDLFTLDGRLLNKYFSQSSFTINTDELAAGNYFLKMEDSVVRLVKLQNQKE